MTKEKIELFIRTAFNWHGRCEDYTEEQVADFYENMNLLDDRGVREILPLLMICELHNYGIKNAFRDMLIYFLDGAYLKRNANGGWWCNEDAHRNEIEFSKVYNIQKDNSGKIVFIETNALLLNYIVKNLALDCYEYMQDCIDGGFNVPLGAFTGIKLLAGYGPLLNVNLTTALSVECKIQRSFCSAGINQTRQTLSAIIFSEITVFAPFYSEYYNGSIEIVLFDNLIVGEVPESYMDVQVIASGKVED